MNNLEDFVKQKLKSELKEVQAKRRSGTSISVFEETIIYKYSVDGYEDLNERLRRDKGKLTSEFGNLLSDTLSKLPNHTGLVYRGVNLTTSEFNRYKECLATGKPLKEYSFISASTSRLIATAFSAGYLFKIWSKTGKNIEQFAKFGIGNPQNEHEVLFANNTSFKVTEVTKEMGYTSITIFEL